MKTNTTDKTKAIEQLREWLKPGDTVYTILESVSRSGMSREIRVVVPRTDETGRVFFLHPNWSVSRAIGVRQGKRDGLVVGGCGMDAGFEVVYHLGRVLWPDGVPCAGERCHSNDHSNGDRSYEPHTHTDGGYALKHEWL
jgi:hypothetical protein